MSLRFLLGVSQATLFPSTSKALVLWTCPAIRSRSNAIVLSGVSIGSAIAPLLISGVMQRWGWRPAILLSAVPTLAVTVYWWVLRKRNALPLPAIHADHVLQDEMPQREETSNNHLRSPGFWLLCGSYSLQGYVGYIFIFWFYLYLVRVRHFDLPEGAFFTSLPWVLSMVSIPLGGWLSDYLSTSFMGPQWGRKIIPVAGLSGAGILLAMGAGTSSPYSAAALLSLSTALVLCVEGPFWATVTEIAGRSKAGAGGGVMNTGCNLGGMLSPVATPWMAERIGWENAPYIAAVLSVIAGLLWIGIRLPEREEGL